MKLIIVESPTKAKTLTKFLKGTYRVEATLGHIRDLPKGDFGVDTQHAFTPKYIIPRDKQKHVTDLKHAASSSDSVILATDPDREGEAIAWHVASILTSDGLKSPGKSKKPNSKDGKSDLKHVTVSIENMERIVFHEITKTAIEEALAHPRVIDMKLVHAQQARRILDRIVGYKLSPLLWQKLSRRWLSAGRVQSVTVRLIVEREREIEAFKKIQFVTIEGTFSDAASKEQIKATLASKNGVGYEKKATYPLFDGEYSVTYTSIPSVDEGNAIINDIKAPYTVTAVDKKEIRRSPPYPFTTSTLQQEAGRKLYFSSKKTMQVAQKLYEEGIITYHRTDSVNLADKFVSEARTYITKQYGSEYIPETPKVYHTKSKVAQEAHEAIRPTDVAADPGSLAENPMLNHDHVRLYELIWKRALACQSNDAVFDSTTIVITSANGYAYQTQGSIIKFEGFLKILGRENGEAVIPKVMVGQELTRTDAVCVEHATNPPPRYTESSLVKALEEKEIGRPSTYAPIISTIIERNYVVKEEKKLKPTELGMAVVDFLVKYFPDILSLPFTASMEGQLDAIANGQTDWVPVVAAFYEPFAKTLDAAYITAEKVKMTVEETGELCPLCNSPLVLRIGRYGKFIACSTYPKCSYTKQFLEKIDIKCPKCSSPMVMKKSRRGKMFYGCSSYPKCTFAAWKKEDIK